MQLGEPFGIKMLNLQTNMNAYLPWTSAFNNSTTNKTQACISYVSNPGDGSGLNLVLNIERYEATKGPNTVSGVKVRAHYMTKYLLYACVIYVTLIQCLVSHG